MLKLAMGLNVCSHFAFLMKICLQIGREGERISDTVELEKGDATKSCHTRSENLPNIRVRKLVGKTIAQIREGHVGGGLAATCG